MLKETLSSHKERINRELETFFAECSRDARKISPSSEAMVELLREFTMRGQSKRFRAFLVILGYHGFGGKDKREIFRAAPFIEIIHSYLLMHDDVIDEDNLRRGGPSAHKYFEKTVKGLNAERAKHYGESMAMMAGDLGCALGYKMFMRSKFPAEIKLRAIGKINQLLHDVIQGETLDIITQVTKDTSREDILKVCEFKTARYSIEQPLQIGAILAGAGDVELKKISKLAIPVGIAFQIKDDMLGLFGDAKVIGKPVGSDIREGKRTLLFSIAFDKADSKQKKQLLQLLGKNDINAKEIEIFRDIIRSTGALADCQTMVDEYIEQGKKGVEGIVGFDKKIKNILFMLFDYINQRSH